MSEFFVAFAISFTFSLIFGSSAPSSPKPEPSPEGMLISEGTFLAAVIFFTGVVLAYFSESLWFFGVQSIIFLIFSIFGFEYYNLHHVKIEPPIESGMTIWERFKRRKEIKAEKERREKEKTERYEKIIRLQKTIKILIIAEHVFLPINIYFIWGNR
ncbi:hypothetical protein KA996_05965 [bacterium]|nr:hypothetical protein [bacterium]